MPVFVFITLGALAYFFVGWLLLFAGSIFGEKLDDGDGVLVMVLWPIVAVVMLGYAIVTVVKGAAKFAIRVGHGRGAGHRERMKERVKHRAKLAELHAADRMHS